MPLRWIIVIIGVWLIVSPFVLNFTGAARGNSIVCGALVAILALLSMARANRREMRATTAPEQQK